MAFLSTPRQNNTPVPAHVNIFSRIQQIYNILDGPQRFANTSGHCRSTAKALMDANEVVMHIVDRNCVDMILDPQLSLLDKL
jgi:hypothetical protein